jgi:cytochrome c oxidase subunit 3
MRPTALVNVSDLPELSFGPATSIWWGVLCLIAIESTMFALLVASYFYLRQAVPQWPPAGTPAPSLAAGTANVAVLLGSLVPMVWLRRVAQDRRQQAVVAGLALCTAFAFAAIVLRGLEFSALHVRWNAHAYGSVVWSILGMHTGHLVSAALENMLLIVVFMRGLHEDKHFVNVAVNAPYWYFVVGAWLPLYAVVFLVPRWF